MRIAVDVLSAATGGPGQYIAALLPHLSACATNDEIHVLAANSGLIARLHRAANVFIHDIPQGRRVASRLLWQRFGMSDWLRAMHIDVVFVAQGLTALRPPPPLVVLHQDSMFFCHERYERSRFYHAAQLHFTRVTLQRSSRKLFVSNAIRSLAEQRGWIPPGEGRIVPYGVNTSELLATADPAVVARLQNDPPFLLSVNSLMPHKNVHGLIDAMAELHRRGRTDIRLLIGGPAPADRPYANDIRAQIDRLRLHDRVTLLGPLDRAAVAAHYRTARLYVTLALLEAHPLTPVEAMAHGLPVLSNDLPAFEEVCGDAGLRVDGTNPIAVADAIVQLWDDEPRRRDLGERGRARAARFSWPRAAELVYQALLEAASQKG